MHKIARPQYPSQFLLAANIPLSSALNVARHLVACRAIAYCVGDRLGDRATKLSALGIRAAPPGKHEDGRGLRLVKRADGRGQWVLRYTLHGRRREMGLGSLGNVPLKEARALAADARLLVAKGIDPIEERVRRRQEARRYRHLLADVVRDAFESRKADLKGDGTAGRSVRCGSTCCQSLARFRSRRSRRAT